MNDKGHIQENRMKGHCSWPSFTYYQHKLQPQKWPSSLNKKRSKLHESLRCFWLFFLLGCFCSCVHPLWHAWDVRTWPLCLWALNRYLRDFLAFVWVNARVGYFTTLTHSLGMTWRYWWKRLRSRNQMFVYVALWLLTSVSVHFPLVKHAHTFNPLIGWLSLNEHRGDQICGSFCHCFTAETLKHIFHFVFSLLLLSAEDVM